MSNQEEFYRIARIVAGAEVDRVNGPEGYTQGLGFVNLLHVLHYQTLSVVSMS